MKSLRKLFFETKPTWPRVLIFAVATAIVTAAALLIPAIEATSVSNIGVTVDCWILFALLIILNCEKPLEAGVKTFVFFLVSQPLIYLLQVPFYFDGWRIFQYYPYWGLVTLLTFPGAMIAWYVKKDNLWSALILSVATGYLAWSCVKWLDSCLRSFPYGLAACIFCGVCAVLFIFLLLRSRKGRLLCGVITLLAALAAVVLTGFAPKTDRSWDLSDEGWEITGQFDSIGSASVTHDPDDALLIHAERYGTMTLELENASGGTMTLQLEYSRKSGLVITEERGG